LAELRSEVSELRNALSSVTSALNVTQIGLLDKCSGLERSGRRTRKVVDALAKDMAAADVRTIADLVEHVRALRNATRWFWGKVGACAEGGVELVPWLDGVDAPQPGRAREWAASGSWLRMSNPMVRAAESQAGGEPICPRSAGSGSGSGSCVWARVQTIDARAQISDSWVRAYDEEAGVRLIDDFAFHPPCRCAEAPDRFRLSPDRGARQGWHDAGVRTREDEEWSEGDDEAQEFGAHRVAERGGGGRPSDSIREHKAHDDDEQADDADEDREVRSHRTSPERPPLPSAAQAQPAASRSVSTAQSLASDSFRTDAQGE